MLDQGLKPSMSSLEKDKKKRRGLVRLASIKAYKGSKKSEPSEEEKKESDKVDKLLLPRAIRREEIEISERNMAQTRKQIEETMRGDNRKPRLIKSRTSLLESKVIKVAILGPIGAGKTTFSLKCMSNRFVDTLPTIGHDIYTFERTYGGDIITLMLYDFQGNPESFNLSLLRQVHCLLVFYDFCSVGHSKGASEAITRALTGTPNGLPVILVGTKRDLLSTTTEKQRQELETDLSAMMFLNEIVSASSKWLKECSSSASSTKSFTSATEATESDDGAGGGNLYEPTLISSKTGEGIEELIAMTVIKSLDFKRMLWDQTQGKSSNGAPKETPKIDSVAYKETKTKPVKRRQKPKEFEEPWWYWLDFCGCCVDCEEGGREDGSEEMALKDTRHDESSLESSIRGLEFDSEEDDINSYCC